MLINCGEEGIKSKGKLIHTVVVDDLKIQGREMDLVAGTHGRSVWILDDISPISQMSQAIIESVFPSLEPKSSSDILLEMASNPGRRQEQSAEPVDYLDTVQE